MQILSVHLTAVRVAKIKKQMIGVVEDIGKESGPSLPAGGSVNWVQTALYIAATFTEQ